MRRKRVRKVGLILGGGAARGLAHIGVVRVLRDAGIPIDLVVGTSIGSLIAGCVALGEPLTKLEDRALSVGLRDMVDIKISRMGIAQGNKLSGIIEYIVGNREFTDAVIPFALVTTDIETGEEVILSTGKLKDAIRASCTVPGVYQPIRVGKRLLVDGGIRNNVPVDLAYRMGATHTIAVDVGYCVKKGRIDNSLALIFQALQIVCDELNKYQAKRADVVIAPPLGEIDQLAFDRAKEIIGIGEQSALKALPEIRRMLRRPRVVGFMSYLWR